MDSLMNAVVIFLGLLEVPKKKWNMVLFHLLSVPFQESIKHYVSLYIENASVFENLWQQFYMENNATEINKASLFAKISDIVERILPTLDDSMDSLLEQYSSLNIEGSPRRIAMVKRLHGEDADEPKTKEKKCGPSDIEKEEEARVGRSNHASKSRSKSMTPKPSNNSPSKMTEVRQPSTFQNNWRANGDKTALYVKKNHFVMDVCYGMLGGDASKLDALKADSRFDSFFDRRRILEEELKNRNYVILPISQTSKSMYLALLSAHKFNFPDSNINVMDVQKLIRKQLLKKQEEYEVDEAFIEETKNSGHMGSFNELIAYADATNSSIILYAIGRNRVVISPHTDSLDPQLNVRLAFDCITCHFDYVVKSLKTTNDKNETAPKELTNFIHSSNASQQRSKSCATGSKRDPVLPNLIPNSKIPMSSDPELHKESHKSDLENQNFDETFAINQRKRRRPNIASESDSSEDGNFENYDISSVDEESEYDFREWDSTDEDDDNETSKRKKTMEVNWLSDDSEKDNNDFSWLDRKSLEEINEMTERNEMCNNKGELINRSKVRDTSEIADAYKKLPILENNWLDTTNVLDAIALLIVASQTHETVAYFNFRWNEKGLSAFEKTTIMEVVNGFSINLCATTTTILFPVCIEDHFILFIYNRKNPSKPTVSYFDPKLKNSTDPLWEKLYIEIINKIEKLTECIYGTQLSNPSKIQNVLDFQQSDGYNCGIFVLGYIDYILRNISFVEHFNADIFRKELIKRFQRVVNRYDNGDKNAATFADKSDSELGISQSNISKASSTKMVKKSTMNPTRDTNHKEISSSSFSKNVIDTIDDDIGIIEAETLRKSKYANPVFDDGKKYKKKMQINGVNEANLPELQIFRNTDEEPLYTIPALVKCCFLETSNSIKTNKQIMEYIKGFGYYKNFNAEQTRKLAQNIRDVFRLNKKVFEGSYGKHKLFGATPEEDIPTPPEEVDERHFENLTYDLPVTTGSFVLDKWRWFVEETNENDKIYKYVKCLDCQALHKKLKDHKWKILGEEIQKESRSGLPIEGKTFKGCLWRPKDAPHFCRLTVKYKNLIEEEKLVKRVAAVEERLKNLFDRLKAKSEKYAQKSREKMEKFPKELKDFLKKLEAIHPCGINEKLAFLYLLRVKGETKPKYYGISCDLDLRCYIHEVIKKLMKQGLDIEMVVAPLGIRNLCYVMDMETCLIRLTRNKELFPEADITNIDDGEFKSVDDVLKKVVENKKQPKYGLIVAAMKQLVEETMKLGEIVDLCGEMPEKKLISNSKIIKKKNSSIIDRKRAPAKEEPSSSYENVPPSSQQPSLENYPQAQKLIEELHEHHPQSAHQLPSNVYIMIDSTNPKKKRYGISHDITNRNQQHIHHKTLGGKFRMITIPIGRINHLFALDLESLLIRLSKMKLLNDGKSNGNAANDHGRFSTKFNIFEAHMDKPSPRRQFLIEALDQLINWSLISNK